MFIGVALRQHPWPISDSLRQNAFDRICDQSFALDLPGAARSGGAGSTRSRNCCSARVISSTARCWTLKVRPQTWPYRSHRICTNLSQLGQLTLSRSASLQGGSIYLKGDVLYRVRMMSHTWVVSSAVLWFVLCLPLYTSPASGWIQSCNDTPISTAIGELDCTAALRHSARAFAQPFAVYSSRNATLK
jgi:hypothetical protein